MFWIQRAQRQAGSTKNYERHDTFECLNQSRCMGLGYTTWGNDADLMAKVYECHWVPRLRKLTKQVIKSCAGCKRFQAIALRNPPPRPLPVDRSQGSTPLEVIGIDFAGPLRYQISRSKTEGKAYIALYSCSLMRTVYLDVTQSLETSEFIRSLKQFIARRGRPVKIYSDDGKTFLGTEKWLKQIMHDDQVQDYLAHQNMKWQFNLSRPSWWGGQFERLT